MMTTTERQAIVNAITYKPYWKINLIEKTDDRPYIQIHYDPPAGQDWYGGKVYLSPHMCRQEIVGKCFGAIQAAESHEMREAFRYKGASIYNPHLDPDELVKVAKKLSNFNVRDDAMGKLP